MHWLLRVESRFLTVAIAAGMATQYMDYHRVMIIMSRRDLLGTPTIANISRSAKISLKSLKSCTGKMGFFSKWAISGTVRHAKVDLLMELQTDLL